MKITGSALYITISNYFSYLRNCNKNVWRESEWTIREKTCKGIFDEFKNNFNNCLNVFTRDALMLFFIKFLNSK